MFTNAVDIKTYVLAGNATVTLTSQRTQARYTFKISQAKAKDETSDRMQLWFVGLLTGPDNYSDYQYMGVINEGGFKLTGKSKFAANSLPVRGFQFFWKHVSEERMPLEMEIRHEGTCGRCGHKLTVPESIDSGLGPDCRAMMGL